MDPLVRAALAVQHALVRASGAALGLGFGAYLLLWATDPPPAFLNVLVACALGLSTLFHLVRRLRRLLPAEANRFDFALFSHLVVGVYAVVLVLPGKLDGPFHALVYAVVAAAAAYSRPAAALGAAGLAVGLEATLRLLEVGLSENLYFHASLILLFALLNLLVFHAELERVRRLSRRRIDAEIQKMKDSARSYRLLSAPGQGDKAGSSAQSEERLLRSGVDEIHQALHLALGLLRGTLGLRTAAVLMLDASGTKLHIQELSTSEDSIDPGPFLAKDGICSAAITRGQPISVAGSRAAVHVPYYVMRPAVGSVSACPVIEHGKVRGVLLVDRESSAEFTRSDEKLLADAAHFIVRAIENERVFVQLERAKIEQGKLYRAADRLAAATTEEQVIEAGVNSAREFTSFDFAVVTLFHRSEGEHEICAASGPSAGRLVGQRFRHNSGLVSMVVANRHALPYRGDYDSECQIVFTRRLRPPDLPSLLVLPLLVHERALGTLVLGSERPHAFSDAVRPTLEVLASHVAVSLANARMLKRLEELATTDGLTSLYNKRALLEAAAQKLKSALRFRKPLSVLVCDIDLFKRVNDTYGHDVGDTVIRGFADVLRRVKRDTDIVGRFGGEELVVVCEETDQHGAMLLGERIRAEFEATPFAAESGEVRVTCSIGIGTCPQAGTEWDVLFKSADEALYASKRGGRNRVMAWNAKLQGAAA
jgi:diguanylate cyclase (GGDEF)-like protein